MRDAVQNYKLYLQQEEVVAEAEFDTADSSPPDTSADIDDSTLVIAVHDPVPTAVDSTQPAAASSSSELAVAMQAMTAAAEQLAAAATRIEAAVQTQRVQQPQQQLEHNSRR
jgi:hypothetical protein